jgi:hypothetical protein
MLKSSFAGDFSHFKGEWLQVLNDILKIISLSVTVNMLSPQNRL